MGQAGKSDEDHLHHDVDRRAVAVQLPLLPALEQGRDTHGGLWAGEYLVFGIGLFTAFLTAFYMFRAWFSLGSAALDRGAWDAGRRTQD